MWFSLLDTQVGEQEPMKIEFSDQWCFDGGLLRRDWIDLAVILLSRNSIYDPQTDGNLCCKRPVSSQRILEKMLKLLLDSCHKHHI
jgi:hypothetical protein